jgi:hypothetical protein
VERGVEGGVEGEVEGRVDGAVEGEVKGCEALICTAALDVLLSLIPN